MLPGCHTAALDGLLTSPVHIDSWMLPSDASEKLPTGNLQALSFLTTFFGIFCYFKKSQKKNILNQLKLAFLVVLNTFS